MADSPLPLREPPAPPPIPPGRRAARLLVRLWPFAAWCLALATAVWLYFGEAGHGHALAIEDIDELKVSPAVAGRIAKLTAELGQRVRKGDVLATLDARDLELRLKLAKAEAERARARLAAWLKSDPAAASDARVLPFEQDLRAQEARVTDLEQELEKYQIIAPAEGTVSRIVSRAGEWRAAGAEIVELVVPRADRLTGYVTDRQISAVAVGTLATLRPRDLGGVPLQGRVVTVGPQIEQVPVRLRAIPNVPQWGRRVIFRVVKSGEPLPGEIYEVRFH
jgi:multidrug resistance efflux pump